MGWSESYAPNFVVVTEGQDAPHTTLSAGIGTPTQVPEIIVSQGVSGQAAGPDAGPVQVGLAGVAWACPNPRCNKTCLPESAHTCACVGRSCVDACVPKVCIPTCHAIMLAHVIRCTGHTAAVPYRIFRRASTDGNDGDGCIRERAQPQRLLDRLGNVQQERNESHHRHISEQTMLAQQGELDFWQEDGGGLDSSEEEANDGAADGRPMFRFDALTAGLAEADGRPGMRFAALRTRDVVSTAGASPADHGGIGEVESGADAEGRLDSSPEPEVTYESWNFALPSRQNQIAIPALAVAHDDVSAFDRVISRVRLMLHCREPLRIDVRHDYEGEDMTRALSATSFQRMLHPLHICFLHVNTAEEEWARDEGIDAGSILYYTILYYTIL
jgi:hypothetical protein